MPGKNGEHATGFVKALSADSPNPEAAYLFMQWATSPAVSLARTMVPYALRDPYRLSHYRSPLYQALWPDAKAYLPSRMHHDADTVVHSCSQDKVAPSVIEMWLQSQCVIWRHSNAFQYLKTVRSGGLPVVDDRRATGPYRAATTN